MSSVNPLVASGAHVSSFQTAVAKRHARATVTAAGDSVPLTELGGRVVAMLLAASEDDVRGVAALLEHHDTTTTTERMISPEEAAALLGVSRPTVVRWAGSGLLEDHRVGAHHRYRREEVLALRDARRRAAEDARAEAARVRDSLMQAGVDLDEPPTREERRAAALAARGGDRTALHAVMERQRRADARQAAETASAPKRLP